MTIRHLAGGTSGLLQFGGASGLLQCLIDCPSAMFSTAIFTTQSSNKIYFYIFARVKVLVASVITF